MSPEEYLSKHGGTRCGLNADWIVQAWYFGPTGAPNTQQGGYYILDVEEEPGVFELVRRWYSESGLSEEIETIMQGDAETTVTTVRAILRKIK